MALIPKGGGPRKLLISRWSVFPLSSSCNRKCSSIFEKHKISLSLRVFSFISFPNDYFRLLELLFHINFTADSTLVIAVLDEIRGDVHFNTVSNGT